MISITCTNENPREMIACATMLQQLSDLGILATPSAEAVTGFAVQTPQDVVAAAVAAVAGETPDPAKVFGGNAQGAATPPPPPAPSIAAAGQAPIAHAASTASSPPPPPGASSPDVQTAQTGNAQPAVPASTVVLAPVDSKGYIWDERVHAKAKTTIADGSFKLKKGVDKALVAQILPTLFRGTAAVAVAPASTSALPPPPPATTATPANPSDPVDVPSLMNWIVKFTAEQRLDVATVNRLIEQSGVPGLHMISEHPDKVSAVVATIKAHLGMA